MQIKVNLKREFVRINNFLDKNRNSHIIFRETNAFPAMLWQTYYDVLSTKLLA